LFFAAKILQALGLFLTVEGLYLGIRYEDMRTELLLLMLGIAAFLAGRRLERSSGT
jgi:hypothetical protein